MNKNEIDEMINFLQIASKYLDKENESKKTDCEMEKLFGEIVNRTLNENGKIAYFKSLFEPEIIKAKYNDGLTIGFGISYDMKKKKYYAYEICDCIPAGAIIFKSKFIAELCADWLNYELNLESGDNCKNENVRNL